jgi:polypeptide N-acetylgalactosaminyltransferase
VNRTPRELLAEIILVNDNSTFLELYEPLTNYIKETFGKLVIVKEMKERVGMINARMDGARYAKGEILVRILKLIL